MNMPDPNAQHSADLNPPSLYDLYRLLSQTTAANARREILGAIFEHDDLKAKLHCAAGKVFRRYRVKFELRAELLQQTRCQLIELLSRRDLAYSDFGAESFSGWFWRVLLTATHRAWRQCRPFWLKTKPSSAKRQLKPVSFGASDEDGEDLQDAIALIPDVITREIIDEWRRGIARGESARLHDVSVAAVRKHRELGLAALRRILLDR